MASSTRQSLAAAKAALTPLLSKADLKFADELFAVQSAIASSAQLRNLLSDPSAEAKGKSQAVAAVFGKSFSAGVLEFLDVLVGLRWSKGSDLVSSLEQLAVYTVAATAANAKNLSQVEGELFAFRQTVDSDQELQFALASRQASEASKVALVDALIGKQASAEAATLIRHAVTGAGRRRVSIVLEQFGKQISAYAERLVATVTVAQPLSENQLKRLEDVLAKNYAQGIKLNVELDPSIIGGVRIQVADEIIDGSLSTRLNEAKLQLA
jgi:F-type H+-transporting ATPase subunit delta